MLFYSSNLHNSWSLANHNRFLWLLHSKKGAFTTLLELRFLSLRLLLAVDTGIVISQIPAIKFLMLKAIEFPFLRASKVKKIIVNGVGPGFWSSQVTSSFPLSFYSPWSRRRMKTKMMCDVKQIFSSFVKNNYSNRIFTTTTTIKCYLMREETNVQAEQQLKTVWKGIDMNHEKY